MTCIMIPACHESPVTVESTYVYNIPTYNNIQLVQADGADSLHFPLSENTYNEIKSFNYFNDNGKAFISFYDRRSESVNMYDFASRQRVKKLHLKKSFKSKALFKTSVYVKNFDSIFVINSRTVYLLDSAGSIKKHIDFYQKTDAMAFFDNTIPVIVQNGAVYMGVRPYVNETSLPDIRRWRVLYKFDLNRQEKDLYYNLPPIYTTNLYDDRFFAYSFCYNEKGNFVFSFPADANIYETNLSNYHMAYYGKSQYQKSPIQPIKKETLKSDEGLKNYLLRDSYGPIYYDPYRKRYLRIVRQKISETAYASKNYKRKYSLIIFDQSFKIIGESIIKDEYSYSSLFFTPDGELYARVNANDEYALHFIRLVYKEEQNDNIKLTKK